MTEFEELWLVPDDRDANDLIKVGWKFIQIVYEGEEIKQHGWFSDKPVGAKKVARYLMARPKGVPPRNKDYNVSMYLQRNKLIKKIREG